MSDTVWLVLRVVNVALYGGIVSGLIMHWRVLRVPTMPAFRWGVLGVIASGGYATAEVAVIGQPGGPRLIPLALSLGVLFVACYLLPARALAQHVRRPRPTSQEKP